MLNICLKIIFDLDGTLANIEHRRHFVANGNCQWDKFFKACDQDEPIEDVINILKAFVEAGHHVEIWSGRSASVVEKTNDWLDDNIKVKVGYDSFDNENIYLLGSRLLHHMRPEDDYRPDTVIKEEWLNQFHQEHGCAPDMIFDDRQSVVDMWRNNGITCAQVAPGDFDNPKNKIIKPNPNNEYMLSIMVGPSGAGKTTYINERFLPHQVVSSDVIRSELCGDFKDQSRNDDVFYTLHKLIETRLRLGLPTVVDATNIRNKDRKPIVDIGLRVDPDMKIEYVVIDRLLEQKIETGGWRNDVIIKDQTLIEKHHNTFQSNFKDILNGDGYKNVTVNDIREY